MPIEPRGRLLTWISELLAVADHEGHHEVALHLNSALIAAGGIGVPPPALSCEAGTALPEPIMH